MLSNETKMTVVVDIKPGPVLEAIVNALQSAGIATGHLTGVKCRHCGQWTDPTQPQEWKQGIGSAVEATANPPKSSSAWHGEVSG